jgi:hypothetical protein
MDTTYLSGFNFWIGSARDEIAGKGVGKNLSWRGLLSLALRFVRSALTYANRLGCPARRALCLRLMNWLRADMRRAS